MQKARSLFICGYICSRALVGVAFGADQEQLIRKVQRASYSYKSEGLASFQCTVQPDWGSLYSTLPVDSIGTQLKPLIEATEFQVSVGSEGAATVSRRTTIPPPSEDIADRLRRVTSGVEETLVGFFNVLAPFSFGGLFSTPEGTFQLVESDGIYRVTEERGGVVSVVTLNQELAVTEMTAKLPQSEITMHPRLLSTDHGFILVGYEYKIRVTATTPPQTVEYDATIEYREIERLRLPSTLEVKVAAPNANLKFAVKFNFTQCAVARR
jgi:hypothetical protein